MQLQLRNEPLPKQQQSVAYRAARLAGLPHDCRGRRAMLEVLDVNLANAIDLKARSAQAGWQARTAGKKEAQPSVRRVQRRPGRNCR